ncbi:MAG TPA: hypothetical protein VGN32_00695 [Ktedonobacterales bacterium]|nr:hypothetical protein [Ktedonobacterales bacterium]
MIKGIFESVLRGVGMLVGIVGALLGLLFTFIHFGVKVADGAFGTGHTPTAIAMSILAFIGALLAIPFPVVSSAIMLVAGIVLIFAIQGFGVVPFIFLLIAAALVFLDRRKKVTAQG